jgi:hypothetical protein
MDKRLRDASELLDYISDLVETKYKRHVSSVVSAWQAGRGMYAFQHQVGALSGPL